MLRYLLISILAVSACAPPVRPSPNVPVNAVVATATEASANSRTPIASRLPTLALPVTPTPGLVLHGRVHLADGSGVGGVAICRSYAAYPGVVVATTGADGSFQSDFAFLPGDEMVGVWPAAAGYTFDPPFMHWRHYYGLEDQTLDFVASPSAATAVPPAPCK
jgi:hypothetical protein